MLLVARGYGVGGGVSVCAARNSRAPEENFISFSASQGQRTTHLVLRNCKECVTYFAFTRGWALRRQVEQLGRVRAERASFVRRLQARGRGIALCSGA